VLLLPSFKDSETIFDSVSYLQNAFKKVMSSLILTTILSILIALERYDPVDKGEKDELCKQTIHIKNLVLKHNY